MPRWIEAGPADGVDDEDVIRFDHAGNAYAIYHARSGFFASDDVCTHAYAHLSDGLVIDDVIECPLHQGRFHIPSGRALSPPACKKMRTYDVKVEAGLLYIDIDPANA